MTLLEIIISLGFLGIIICLGLTLWTLQQLIVKPKLEANRQAKQLVETEIKQAKFGLEAYTAETRMDSPKKTVGSSPDLEKLKGLRRKK